MTLVWLATHTYQGDTNPLYTLLLLVNPDPIDDLRHQQ